MSKELPIPSQIVKHLNRFVHGQARAKRDLSVAVYNHYLSQAHAAKNGEDLGRHHILLIGPTGVGKTYLVKTLADFLDVPVAFTSATSLSETGYKGNDVDTILSSLLSKTKGNPRLAEKGIIFLDEVDKINESSSDSSVHRSEGVQNDLLTYLDGITASKTGSSEEAIDTGKLLFICTGAFVGLDKIVDDRLGKNNKQIGFKPREEENASDYPDQPIYEALVQTQTKDLVQFGMIPEFVGRFSTITVLHELSSKDLLTIISKDTERSPIDLQEKLAAIHGIKLVFSEKALEDIARQAEELGTGARGLHRLVGQALDCIDYRLPELADEGVSKITISLKTIQEGEEPELEKKTSAIPRIDAILRAEALLPLPLQDIFADDGSTDDEFADEVSADDGSADDESADDEFTYDESADDESANDEFRAPLDSFLSKASEDQPSGSLGNLIKNLSHHDIKVLINKKIDTVDENALSKDHRSRWNQYKTDNGYRPGYILAVIEALNSLNFKLSDYFDKSDSIEATNILEVLDRLTEDYNKEGRAYYNSCDDDSCDEC